MSHITSNDQKRRMVRVDDGRRLLSVSALAAGGAVIALSVGSLLYTAIYSARAPIYFDILAAVAGAVTAFAYLIRMTPIFFHKEDE